MKSSEQLGVKEHFPGSAEDQPDVENLKSDLSEVREKWIVLNTYLRAMLT